MDDTCRTADYAFGGHGAAFAGPEIQEDHVLHLMMFGAPHPPRHQPNRSSDSDAPSGD